MAGSLEFIKSAEITTSVSTFDVTDCFSANYDVYKIVIDQLTTTGTASTDVAYRFIDNTSSVISSSNYDWASLGLLAYNPFQENRATGETYIRKLGQADQEPEGVGIVSYIYNPFSSSSYTFTNWQSSYSFGSGKGGTKGIGVLKLTSSITGVQIYAVSQTRPFDSGKISVYGVK